MDVSLAAERRNTIGKNDARRLRRTNRIPAIVYGHEAGKQAEPVQIAVDPKALLRILHSESGVNSLIALRIDGGGEARVLVKEYQLNPVTHQLLHADFYRVAMDRAIVVTVPVALKGEPRGVKQQGGILDFVHREIQIECLPGDIPENIEVDVSELMLGQSVRLREVIEGVKWKALSDPDTMIAHVIAPKAEEVPAPAEAAVVAAPAEPEVIKKGKVEKEEEEE